MQKLLVGKVNDRRTRARPDIFSAHLQRLVSTHLVTSFSSEEKDNELHSRYRQ
jgi:hypothetical protein